MLLLLRRAAIRSVTPARAVTADRLRKVRIMDSFGIIPGLEIVLPFRIVEGFATHSDMVARAVEIGKDEGLTPRIFGNRVIMV